MALTRWIRSLVCCLIGIVPVLTVQAQEDELPEGKGKQTLEHTCTECHGLDKVFSKLRPAKDWRIIAARMRAGGATMTDPEFTALVDYLVENFGDESAESTQRDKIEQKVKVNRATAKELQTALQINADEAAAIVRHRERNGRFKEWRDLTRIDGVDKRRLEHLKNRVSFEP
jgi:competence protein ComEA